MSSQDKFDKVLKEFSEGKLKSHGKIVKNKDQALAIAFSEARKENPKFELGGSITSDEAKYWWDNGLSINSKHDFYKSITPKNWKSYTNLDNSKYNDLTERFKNLFKEWLSKREYEELKLEKGDSVQIPLPVGVIDGPSHSENGVKTILGGKPAEVEGEEIHFIINKKSSKIKDHIKCSGTPEGITSRINELEGNGIKFSDEPGKCEIMEKDIEETYFGKGGKVKIISTDFKSHKKHNPDTDIVSGMIDDDSFITYHVNINTGEEGMEFYTGENYVVKSQKKSYSRNFKPNEIPEKYKDSWMQLKEEYESKYKEKMEKGKKVRKYKKGNKIKYEGGGTPPKFNLKDIVKFEWKGKENEGEIVQIHKLEDKFVYTINKDYVLGGEELFDVFEEDIIEVFSKKGSKNKKSKKLKSFIGDSKKEKIQKMIIKDDELVKAENGYKGKTQSEIWNGWNKDERYHFLFDHKEEIGIKDFDEESFSSIVKDNYDDLHEDVKQSLKGHTLMGQYQDGTKIENQYIKVNEPDIYETMKFIDRKSAYLGKPVANNIYENYNQLTSFLDKHSIKYTVFENKEEVEEFLLKDIPKWRKDKLNLNQ